LTAPRRRRRRRFPWRGLSLVLFAVVLAGAGAVWLNLFGVGDKAESLVRRVALIVNPPPDRPIDDVVVTPPPSVAATAAPSISLAPGETPPPTPSPTPKPKRHKVDVNILDKPADFFISEYDHEWCAVAGVQMVLAINGKAPLTVKFQKELAGRVDEWESRRDSRNGDWGPTAMAKALAAYGVEGYEVRTYETRPEALRDAAKAISAYDAPVLLLAWRGAHTWVMTGYRASADPLIFDDAKVAGAYVLDPWFPIYSSIWGYSDPPGTYQDPDEMQRNFLPWDRPEGSYPNRDGKFIAVVPTQPRLK
jgi:hypothetical protein